MRNSGQGLSKPAVTDTACESEFTQPGVSQSLAANRKNWHIEAAHGQQPQSEQFTGLRFNHCALPDINMTDIDLSAEFLGQRVALPLLISSMTGGTDAAAVINQRLLCCAERYQLPIGVGSQRISFEHGGSQGLDQQVRQWAPTTLVLANLGLANLLKWDPQLAIRHATECIQADALIIHLNPFQEAFQQGGDTAWRGAKACLQEVIRNSPVPVIVKEVGFGLDPSTLDWLMQQLLYAVDLAGKGGTDFAKIEAFRHADERYSQAVSALQGWGYGVVELLAHVKRLKAELSPKRSSANPLVIASGGISNASDGAKCLALGADYFAMAGTFLKAARSSEQHLDQLIDQIALELELICFGCGVSRPQNICLVGDQLD